MVTLPSLLDGYLRCRGTGASTLRIALRKEVAISSERSISTCKTTVCLNSEDHNVNNGMRNLHFVGNGVNYRRITERGVRASIMIDRRHKQSSGI
jgi:hypothetical protein